MAIGRYRGVNGVARKVVKRYRGVDGVARAIVSSYRGVDGVARQYFSAGVAWRKWSCYHSPETTYYEEVDSTDEYTVGETGSMEIGDNTYAVWEGYYFDGDNGGFNYTSGYHNVGGSELVGYYLIRDTYVLLFTGAEEHLIGGWWVDFEVVGVAEEYYRPESYEQGDTDYGVIYVQGGEAPDDGEIVDGSLTGNYCVVLVDGEYYYYEKIT